jgi:signal transduction histidine kinase
MKEPSEFFKFRINHQISWQLVVFGLMIVLVPAVATFVIRHYFFDVSTYDFIRVTFATSMLFFIILIASKVISNREREILKYRSESVFVINQDANIIFCNELTLKHFGIGNLLGRPISVVAESVVDTKGKALVSGPGRLALTGVVNTMTMRSLITGRWMSVTANPVYQNGIVTHAICVMTDITESKNNELKQNQIIEERERFFGMVTHDLKSPISSVQMSAQLLRDQLSDRSQLKLVEVLLRNAKEIDALIDDLLNLVKIQAEKIPLLRAAVPLKELVDDLVVLNGELLKFKNLKIVTSIEAIECFCDEQRTKQIINNLISNAIKFSPPHTSINIRASIENEICTFCVEDSGAGIPHEMLQSIFNPFVQVSSKDSARGTGLGLSIVKYLVDAQGGQAWAESTVGLGSKLFFTLPLKAESPPA